MRLVDRYIVRQLVGPFIFFLCIFGGILWLNQALKIVDVVVENGQPGMVFVELSLYLLPRVMEGVIPVAVFAAALFLTNRLYAESEYAALMAAGQSPLQFARPFLIFGVISFIVVSALAHFITPISNDAFYQRQHEIRQEYLSQLIKVGEFINPKKGVTFYFGSLSDDGLIMDILIKETTSNGLQVIHTAPTGRLVDKPENAKLVLIDGQNGKMDPAKLRHKVENTGNVGVHNIQRGAVSITNVTEVGTIYSLSEIQALTAIAHEYGLPAHLDGARFTNALVALDCTPAEMTWKSGIDVVSFGGTKNGCMGVEAVIIFDPAKAWEFELRRKRGGHLCSKNRYLAAQMESYLTDDLWLKLAKHANAMGTLLATGLGQIETVKFQHPQQANMLFCGWPRSGHELAQAAGAMYYPWPADHPETGPADEFLTARLVTSWSTTPQDVEEFLKLIAHTG